MVLAKRSRGVTLNNGMLTMNQMLSKVALHCFVHSFISFAIFMKVSWNLPAFFFQEEGSVTVHSP